MQIPGTLSALAALAASAALGLGLTVAVPARAQGMADLPRLDFPAKDGDWGCRFSHKCLSGGGAAATRR